MSFDKKTKSLDNVSLEFKENQITGLIGFNGSGKTTTFNIMADFLTKYTGHVEIDGVSFGKVTEEDKAKYALEKEEISKEIEKVKQHIADETNPDTKEILIKRKKLLMKSPVFKSMTARKILVKKTMSYLGASIPSRDAAKVISYLKHMGYIYGLKGAEVVKIANDLAAKMNFTQFLDKPIKSLSKGNQQKIKVISALLNPRLKYLILDEPFDGLDPVMVESIKKIFLELKDVTIIITSHRMEVVQSMCKEFYVLKDGILIDAKTTADKKITISVNKEVSMVAIKKLKCVLEVKKAGDKNIIIIDSIENFQVVNKKLVADKGYVYSSLEEKNISASVFEGYGE